MSLLLMTLLFFAGSLADDRVKVSLYYEALCPDCKDWILNQLHPTWQDIPEILNIDLIPYGNANHQVLPNGTVTFDCQHGPDECYVNFVDTCILDFINYNTTLFMPFLYCTEGSDNPPADVKKCATESGFDWNQIRSCATGPKGQQLSLSMAKRTDALQPPHTWVPWIIINDVYNQKQMDEATINLKKVVCETYKGPNKPTKCAPY